MVGDAALSLTGIPAHPQDIEGRIASKIPRVVALTVGGVGVLWWAMAGRPPHMPPPPVAGPGPYPTTYPTAHPTAAPQGGTSDGVGDVGDAVADAADSACDICDCMSGCDGCDLGGCDLGGCDCGGLDCGGLDCGGCDVSCNVANSRSIPGGVRAATTCARRSSPLHTAGTALALGAPLFVLAGWRRRRVRSSRSTPACPSGVPQG